ncbi:chaplin [Wenjunlia tyrosinilytica]|uniref:Chaplin domain-containing protein n=1 Tax=Wenjunlia tyrosinilytica TaxID=1544741 RepID=A0A918DZS6_9ACTN|nr:chaplin [Wenjunlia tyrosinilytica]GGO90773.1 hypothetical protein GCM10012280_37070 [Wenjunlia tyrosinilytica]
MSRIAKAAVITLAAGAALGGAAGVANADAEAEGGAFGSPGVISGNNIQLPVDIPINVCGNSVTATGALNPTFGNTCVNASTEVEEAAKREHKEERKKDDHKKDEHKSEHKSDKH